MSDATPVGTFAISAEVMGTCFVPDVFAENMHVLVASLDFARVWNTHQHWSMTAQELRSAATAARKIADDCEAFAKAADSISTVELGQRVSMAHDTGIEHGPDCGEKFRDGRRYFADFGQVLTVAQVAEWQRNEAELRG